MSGFLGYPEPDDQFSKIIADDKELQKLIDPKDKKADLSDPRKIISEDEHLAPTDDNPDDNFWSDR